jgi:1-acyl-sn-glycerol-3-phosphate acyltransferase
VRFVMDHQIFKVPVLSFVFRTAARSRSRRSRKIRHCSSAPTTRWRARSTPAKLVGIFPEGRITDTGELYPFKSGIQKILERTPVPVVPIALQGLWGSYFSRKGGRR